MLRAGGELALTVGASDRAQARTADGDLVERLQAGEREAFEELVRDYQAGVYGLLYHLLGEGEDARDAAQETFLKVYRHIGRFRGECELRTWIYRIAVNQAANYLRWWRRRRRDRTISLDAGEEDSTGCPLRESLADPHATPEQQVIEDEQRRSVQQALHRLKPAFRAVLVLRDIEGCSYEEIAQMLGISLGTVKSRIARGREMLRQQVLGMQRHWGDSTPVRRDRRHSPVRGLRMNDQLRFGKTSVAGGSDGDGAKNQVSNAQSAFGQAEPELVSHPRL